MVLNDSFSSLKIKTDKSVSISSSMTPWSAYVHSQCHNWFVLYPEALPHSHETPANKSTHQKLRPKKVHVKNSGQQKYTSKTPANKSTRQKLWPTKVHVKNSDQQKYTSKTLAIKSTRQKVMKNWSNAWTLFRVESHVTDLVEILELQNWDKIKILFKENIFTNFFLLQ